MPMISKQFVTIAENDAALDAPSAATDGGKLPPSPQRTTLAELHIAREDGAVSQLASTIPLVWAYFSARVSHKLDDNTEVTIAAGWTRMTRVFSALDDFDARIPFQQRILIPADAERIAVTLVSDAGDPVVPPAAVNAALRFVSE